MTTMRLVQSDYCAFKQLEGGGSVAHLSLPYSERRKELVRVERAGLCELPYYAVAPLPLHYPGSKNVQLRFHLVYKDS
ncbi:hypothetical protein NQZ68_018742 [Dissostichus eleginoides]|nr:hypothetical protein NQZ68_018742 [Dissostichus eleginoides]